VSFYSGPVPGPFGPGFSNFGIDDVELQPQLQAVPEPSTLALMLGGLVIVVRRLRANS
jgi:hypothetical protein